MRDCLRWELLSDPWERYTYFAKGERTCLFRSLPTSKKEVDTRPTGTRLRSIALIANPRFLDGYPLELPEIRVDQELDIIETGLPLQWQYR